MLGLSHPDTAGDEVGLHRLLLQPQNPRPSPNPMPGPNPNPNPNPDPDPNPDPSRSPSPSPSSNPNPHPNPNQVCTAAYCNPEGGQNSFAAALNGKDANGNWQPVRIGFGFGLGSGLA